MTTELFPTIENVKEFWEVNPLWTGESKYTIASKEFFEEHRHIVINDCLGGEFDKRTIPEESNMSNILDLGCGIGFWTVELALKGCSNITAADLTSNALSLTKKRCEIYGVTAELSLQNAEALTFDDKVFNHVNCQGVIHHTPNTEVCIKEIARVLRDGGSASISVYYKNMILRKWSYIRWIGKILVTIGCRLSGRGRDNIFLSNDTDEIVRLYDGKDNPIGKCYSREEFIEMLSPYFYIEETYLHYFPSRIFPIKLPKAIKKMLDKYFGFLIYATVRKR